MEVDIKRAKSIYNLLSALSELNTEIKNLEGDASRILLETEINLGTPADVINGVEVKIKERPLREVRLAPLRCKETTYTITGVTIDGYGLVLEGYWHEKGSKRAELFKHEIRLRSFRVYDLLTLACNLEVSEVEELVNAVREKKKLLEEDIAKLKELVAYAKLVLS